MHINLFFLKRNTRIFRFNDSVIFLGRPRKASPDEVVILIQSSGICLSLILINYGEHFVLSIKINYLSRKSLLFFVSLCYDVNVYFH